MVEGQLASRSVNKNEVKIKELKINLNVFVAPACSMLTDIKLKAKDAR